MKKVTLSLATLALVGLYAGTASAQCQFDIVPSKGVKGSMVRNYAPCPGTEHGNPNTETEGETEACSPVTPRAIDGDATEYTYGPEGGCTVQTQAKLVSACEKVKDTNGDPIDQIDPGPCHVTYVKGKCSGILQPDGLTLIGPTDVGFSLATLSRATLADPTNGDMTVIDFPVSFAFGEPKSGGMKLKHNSAAALAPLVGGPNSDLPECTSIEIVDVTIKDPAGLPFAKLGGATVPE